MFGDEKGGLTRRKQCETWPGGACASRDIVLDEIADLDLNLQSKLAALPPGRNLFKKKNWRQAREKVDARLILAPTNKDLEAETETRGGSGKDLYYRIHVFVLKDAGGVAREPAMTVPPLARIFPKTVLRGKFEMKAEAFAPECGSI